jgi:hypothetical protein
MPHDAHGKLLKVGDEVVIRGKITNITAAEEYCNCTVEYAPMPPYTAPSSLSSLNTRQVELVEKADSAT